MTYIEWKDELNSYLAGISREEREKVFSYFSEMYADKRDAGFSEKEIINEFGAPYDAAQKILSESDWGENKKENPDEWSENKGANPKSPDTIPKRNGEKKGEKEKKRLSDKDKNVIILILLIVILAAPLFSLIMTAVGITIGFVTAPSAVVGGGITAIVYSFIELFTGSGGAALVDFGGGLMCVGIGLILCALFFKVVELIWKLIKKLFTHLNNLL